MLDGDGSGHPVLEYFGKLCILHYTNVNWLSGQTIPEGYRPFLERNAWASVSSSESNDNYRIYVGSNGTIQLQKNGVNCTNATNVRGQVIWVTQ